MPGGIFVKGFVVGVGVAVALPIAAVAVVTGAAPLARAAGRGGAVLARKAREAAAEAGEIVEDLIAESRAGIEADVTGGEEQPFATADREDTRGAATGQG
jgi:hypothetical protein